MGSNYSPIISKFGFIFSCAGMFVLIGNAAAQKYEVPPSSSTTSNVPYISDADMEACVKIYNEAKWLAAKIDRTSVNRYSNKSVNAYNRKIRAHKRMIRYFNDNCAGRQSESAWRAAQELNKRKK